MSRYAAALSGHPDAAEALGEVTGEVLDRLGGAPPDLVVWFASPHHLHAFSDVAHGLRHLLQPRCSLGASAVAVVGGAREVEGAPALSVFAASFDADDAAVVAVDLAIERAEGELRVIGWPEAAPTSGTLLLLADPFSFPVDQMLDVLADVAPGLRVVGGLASAGSAPGINRLDLDGRVRRDGAVGVILESEIGVDAVVSQGCRPLGRPLTVTRAERNLVGELAGRPALTRLRELAGELPPDERALLRGGLHLGVVVDEHQVDFGRGDFLVRNITGADSESGALAIGDEVAVGQTVQFHARDAESADDDLRALLAGRQGDAALMFTCNGRGTHLFGTPDHDAAALAEALGPVPTAGAFCAGEIGPVGPRSFLHGFTAAIALFRS